MTDTVTAKLAEWEALVEGATPGSWEPTTSQPTMDNRSGYRFGDPRRPAAFLAHQMRYEDAAFIAAAPTIVRALLGFVKEVRDGHVEKHDPLFDEPACERCHQTWPCDTEQAARKWIGGEG